MQTCSHCISVSRLWYLTALGCLTSIAASSSFSCGGIGPVEVKLFARTSAADTDFTSSLVDVHVDGVTHNVLDRIVRASLRHGS